MRKRRSRNKDGWSHTKFDKNGNLVFYKTASDYEQDLSEEVPEETKEQEAEEGAFVESRNDEVEDV